MKRRCGRRIYHQLGLFFGDNVQRERKECQFTLTGMVMVGLKAQVLQDVIN